MIAKGTKGAEVITLQLKLNEAGAKLKADGDFGTATEAALKAYQTANLNTKITGVLDAETLACMYPLVLPCAKYVPMKRGQYHHGVSDKRGVCLHHTAGGPKAESVGPMWDRDKRGNVATHLVVGADGTIIQTMPLQCWANHIAMFRVGMKNDTKINSQYIGIEICNWGYLDLKEGIFINYVNRVVPANEAVQLDKPFMGKKYWHKYTDAQIKSVRLILAELKEIYGFKYENLPLDASWFDIDTKAQNGIRVLATHTNFEGNKKADCSPQPAFFEMIKP